MSHTSGSRWLIFIKRSNCMASLFSTSFLRCCQRYFLCLKTPFFNLVILSTVEGSKPSVSVKPFPNTLAPWLPLSLSRRPHRTECPTHLGADMCILGFLFNRKLFMCFITPATCIFSCSQHRLFYPITLTALSRTLDTEQLEVISSSSELS